MKEKLRSGTTLVLDRYAFSGVAFTRAKAGFGDKLGWCQAPDAGLPVPDLLVHLEVQAGVAEARGGFGDERYEVSEFQQTVKQTFRDLYASLTSVEPVMLDVSGQSIEQVGERVDALVEAKMQSEERASLTKTLW